MQWKLVNINTAIVYLRAGVGMMKIGPYTTETPRQMTHESGKLLDNSFEQTNDCLKSHLARCFEIKP